MQKICKRAVIINKGKKIDDFRFDEISLSGDELEDYFLARTSAEVNPNNATNDEAAQNE